VKAGEVTVPSASTPALTVYAAGDEQEASPGPYRRNVTAPLAGLDSPASVAVSVADAPMTIESEDVLCNVGAALATATFSSGSLQAPSAAELLASPP